jgi:aminomethyltransferase
MLLTPLNAAHKQLEGRLVDFAGWEMPVQYEGLTQEHRAVRTACGLFDVSHMGEIEFKGAGALAEVNRLVSNDVTKIADGQAVYAGLLNQQGGFVDDVVVYRFSDTHLLICVNASNRDKDFAWMHENATRVKPVNRSDEFAQIAVQGPKAADIVQRLSAAQVAAVKTYHFINGAVAGVDCLIARTGYTGEDGFELYCPPKQAESLWFALLEEGKRDGVKPCGLGARDSLRTEMKYALYGNDIDDEHTPLEASLGWIVKLDKPEFIGKSALEKQKTVGLTRKLVGFEMVDAGIPRSHYAISVAGRKVGEVTSGTMGPSIQKAVGIGYVELASSSEGSLLDIDIRGRAAKARVVKTPFYRKPSAS